MGTQVPTVQYGLGSLGLLLPRPRGDYKNTFAYNRLTANVNLAIHTTLYTAGQRKID
jgi:hypothetical protein